MGEGERPMDDRKNMPQNNGNVIQNLILENNLQFLTNVFAYFFRLSKESC